MLLEDRDGGDRDLIHSAYKTYQPVLYQVNKDPKADQKKEDLKEVQASFIMRTERLLELFH